VDIVEIERLIENGFIENLIQQKVSYLKICISIFLFLSSPPINNI